MRRNSSIQRYSSESGGPLRIFSTFSVALALVVIVGVAVSCKTPAPLELELVECEDPSESAMSKFGELPPEWQDWYLHVYDPGCDAICRTIHGEDQCEWKVE
jgi:hypothetical protein